MYLDRMQESQESIYYVSGDSVDTMNKAPSLQMFREKGIEVRMLSTTWMNLHSEARRL